MVVIVQMWARSAGNVSEQEQGQTNLLEQIQHVLADLSGSQADHHCQHLEKKGGPNLSQHH